MRVLFLAIDGVLCCNSEGLLEADKVRQLMRIASQTGVKVCLSSNWRLYDPLRSFLYERLAAVGIEVVGTTPDAGEAELDLCMRPHEICGWLKTWHRKGLPRIESFVAVDDCALLQELGGAALRGHFVQTDSDLGLTEDAASRIIELLLAHQPFAADADGAGRCTSPTLVTAICLGEVESPPDPRPSSSRLAPRELEREIAATTPPQEQELTPPTGAKISTISQPEVRATQPEVYEEAEISDLEISRPGRSSEVYEEAIQAAHVAQAAGVPTLRGLDAVSSLTHACFRHGAPLSSDASGSSATLSAWKVQGGKETLAPRPG